MDYIEQLLGFKTDKRKSIDTGKYPAFIVDEYDFFDIIIDNKKCIILVPVKELAPINSLKKHIALIKNTVLCPVIIEMKKISKQRRNTLIENKIPFVIPGKQLYLPFIGAMITERCDSETVMDEAKKLTPSAQMLLLYFISKKGKELYTADVADILGVSAMTVSRAVNELAEYEILTKQLNGIQVVLSTDKTSKMLFETSMKYFDNPVRKTVYVYEKTINSNSADLFSAGETALSEKTLLNPPKVKTYGFVGAKKELGNTFRQLIDGDRQCAVEMWRYDPRRISGTGKIDPLSLAVSLSSDTDERVEQCVNEMLAKVW